MDTVFDHFPTIPYTFLELGQGGARGNKIISETAADGIFKERNGMTVNQNMETVESTATLKIRPTEPFVVSLAAGKTLVGHGVRVNGRTYRIVGYPGGDNFDDGMREHIRLVLKAESIAS